MRFLSATTQYVEQNENDRQIAKYKCEFQPKDRLMNRRDSAEEKLSSCWIWARYIRVVQCTGLGCLQPGERRIAGNNDIRVITEPLHAAIPKITMNVII